VETNALVPGVAGAQALHDSCNNSIAHFEFRI
jgi:hypothetical protein